MAPMMRTAVAVVLSAVLAAACSQDANPSASAPAESPTSEVMSTQASRTSLSGNVTASASNYAQMLAVGDIASCDSDGDEKVAQIASERGGRIALLGDIVYPNSTAEVYANCFDPAWGAFAARFRPAVGNHEYIGTDAGPYWDYFGDWSGQRGRGWYAYDSGPYWRVIVLNSNCKIVGCSATSPQGKWLVGALERAGNRHVMAVFHHPRFSSGRHGNNTAVAYFWRALYAAGADLVLNGHDHHYERFAPQNPQGERRSNGIQEFVVGTGGYRNYDFDGPPLATTAVRDNTGYGLLVLRLRQAGYSWAYVPAEGSVFTDSGARRL